VSENVIKKMINELLTVKTWLTENFVWDIRLYKQKTPVRVISVESDGSFQIDEDVNQTYRYHYVSNHVQYLKCKTGESEKKDSLVVLTKFKENTIAYLNKLPKSEEYGVFNILLENIKKLNIDSVNSETKQSKKMDTFFEIGNPLDGIVNCEDSYRLLDKFLKENEIQEGSLDILGGNYSIKEDTGTKQVNGIILYTKNKDNKCFERFEMNSSDAFPLGLSSYSLIAAVLENILKNKDIYFSYKLGDDMFYVIGNIVALEEEFRANNESIVLENIKAIKNNQQISVVGCGIFIIKKPSKGPSSVVYSKQSAIPEIENFLKVWATRSLNADYPSFLTPKIPTVIELSWALNFRFKQEGDKIVRNEKIKNGRFNISDSYDVLFNKKSAIQKVASTLATYHCSYLAMIADKRARSYPEDVISYIIAACNIVLGYNGVNMKTWSSCLGMILRDANKIHELYFTTRGRPYPKRLIGMSYIDMVTKRPRSAFLAFWGNYKTYRDWADTYDGKNAGLVHHCVNSINKNMENIGEKLPVVASEVDSISIILGYRSQPSKKEEVV